METLLKDLRYGFRGIAKRKGFASIAIATLALGIGANTTIFTLHNHNQSFQEIAAVRSGESRLSVHNF